MGVQESALPERPELKVSKTGVYYVRPADILNSKVGREQIAKTADLFRRLKNQERSKRAETDTSRED